MMGSTTLENIIGQFQGLTQKPVKFLTVQEDVKEDIKNLVKNLYDFTKSEETKDKKGKTNALPDLIVEDFDEEQIWQEIELQNSDCWEQLVWDVANCLSTINELKFPVETVEEPIESEPELEEENLSDNESVPSENEHEKLPEKASKKKGQKLLNKSKPSVVDDKFFKLQEMEQFLLSEEKAGGSKGKEDSDEESIDLFEDVGDDESGNEKGDKDMMYGDFFDGNDQDDGEYEDENSNHEIEEHPQKKNDKKVRFEDAMSSDDTDSSEVTSDKPNNNNVTSKDEKKSEFELRQQRLQQQISRLEEKTLKDAPWQLKGEIDGTKRPQNSLLQEVVDFDLTTRPPPIITEQTTITLEQIIKQRVKDKAWDDVIRKDKPVDDQLSFRKTEIIDQSKSKQSLAQVYEAEYLKQKHALSGDVEDEQEPESHKEIRESMSKLFSKLDALCNYHYTPKAAHAEVKIVSNTPAISMEEVAPVATSDAALLAPEEVKKKHRGDLMSKEERTKTDRNRERRKKKKLQQKKGKVEKVTEHRNTKKTVEASNKSLKTSRAFFQQLNAAK